MGRTFRRRKQKRHNQADICRSIVDFIEICKLLKMKFKHGLTPKLFPETGRGLMTKHPIKPGELIIQIPGQYLITMETILYSCIGDVIRRCQAKLKLQQAMSVFLVTETRKGHNSKWWPYLNVLPKTSDTPAFWATSDLVLFSKNVYRKILFALNDLQIIYEQTVDFLESSKIDINLNYKEFRWAWYCINSRSVYYVNDNFPFFEDTNKNIALAPYLDLLNHSTWAKVDAGFNKHTNCYEIRTYNSYKKYDQVFISYGPHNNLHLLMEYGFILPNNPHDVYEINYSDVLKCTQNLNIENIDKKKTIIGENELNKKLVCSVEGLSWSMVTLLKVLAMDFNELKSWKLVYTGDVISVKNQQTVGLIAQRVLQDELTQLRSVFQKFPSLDVTTLTYHQKMAWDLLKIEENILLQSIKLI